MSSVHIKEVSIDEALQVHLEIPEFDAIDHELIEKRCGNKNTLIICAYLDGQKAGYLIGYDKFGGGSFYCWMAGVIPRYRRRGTLTSLMAYCMQWATTCGYAKLKIKTRNNRREMLSFLVANEFNFIEVEQKEPISQNRISLERALN